MFEDFNADGTFDTTSTLTNANGGTIRTAVDVGLSGVTVTAYNAANTAVATATTAADGTYTLTGLAPGTTYRVEFTALPTGFVEGPQGPNSGTSVQFVGGGASGVDLGLVNPNAYSTNDPTLATSVYAYGDAINGQYANNAVIESIPYTAGGTATDTNTPATTLATAGQVGSVFGLATSRQTGIVYAAAYTKLHAGYGPSGNGAIYAVNPATNTVTTFADLNAILGANTTGVNFRSGYASGNAAYFNDSVFTNGAYTDSTGSYTSWDAVGNTAFGGMAVSDDGSTLYVMNLANRTLYSLGINADGTYATGSIESMSIPFNAPGATGTNNGTQAGDLQPFAVTYYNGELYVGIVNSAQSTQHASDLHAYVYQVNPTTLQFSAQPVFEVANMTYNRTLEARFEGTGPATWHPWSPVYANEITDGLVYAQPMLTGIAFDAAGNMTLGFRDRAGDQGGDVTPANPADTTATYETYAAGETLRAFGNPANGWTLESDGAGPGGTPVGFGAGSGYGPGGGQFYQQDYTQGATPPAGHGYVDTGGVAQVPGFPDVVVSSFDPFETGDFRTGGVRFLDTGDGAIEKADQLYYRNQPGTFGKANGIGNIAFLSTPAPIEIGNRVFEDPNATGIQAANDPGIAGVTVDLYDAAGNKLATAVTDANGDYYFSSATGNNTTSAIYNLNLQPDTQYSVRLDDPADYTTGPLKGLIPTRAFVGSDTAIDSNGVEFAPTDTRAAVTTGAAGASDHTFDFGFTPALSLGNVVFNDANNDGVLDNGETGISGVTVSLLDSNGNPVDDYTGTLITTTTDANGNYLFTNLLPGTYEVRLSNLPAGFTSSTGTDGSASGPYEPGSTNDTDVGNNTDHGTNTGGTVTSQPVTLTVAGTNPDTGSNGVAGTANLNVDFGLFRPLSLGNFVWNDANNDGVLDSGETGVNGVVVDLLGANGQPITDANGHPITTTTANGGAYEFTDLGVGTYEVRLDTSNFTGAGALVGYKSSTGTNGSASGPYEPGSTNYTDIGNNTDHGTADANDRGVTSQPVALTAGTNPDTDANGIVGAANFNVDFGVYKALSLGNVVFDDANNDGVLDNGETGISGVTVTLLDSNGNPLLDSNGTPITTTTDANGNYLFTNLLPGTYEVRLSNLPAGFTSSSGTKGSASGPYEPGSTNDTDGGNNTDHGTNTGGGTVTSQPVTLTAPGTNPDADSNGVAGTANLNVDFGLFQPLSLGNFVWNDANNDGVLDNGETGISGVTVTLLDSNGNPLLDSNGNPITTTTDANGNYLFTNLLPGTYEVRLSNLPAGFTSSSGTKGSASGPYEPGSTNDTDVGNNTDHGTNTGGTVTSQPVTLTAGGTNPDADANGFAGAANLNVDFGLFRPLSLGNFVWNDANNDGVLDSGETGVNGVVVDLLGANGQPITDANGHPITTTTANGGAYEFTDLGVGTYEVRLDTSNFTGAGALVGYKSSTGTNGSASGPYEPGSTNYTDIGNNTDHGIADANDRGVTSQPVALTAAGTNPDTGANGVAGTANLNVDFGVYKALSLGNVVFDDANNDGVLDNGETGIGGVTVTLLDGNGNVLTSANGTPITTTTDANGNYLFTGLTPGTYEVRLSNLPAGFTSSTGTNGSATGPDEVGSTNDTDGGNDTDHGTNTGGGTVTSQPVALTAPGTNPDTGSNGVAGTANLNVDFGLFQPLSLGNVVFADANNDGVLDDGETGIGGVTVTLLDGNGNPITDSSGNPIATTTDANGNYLFTGLAPGTYEVRLSNLPAGFTSSTGTNGSASGPVEVGSTNDTDAGNDTDHGTNTGGGTVTSQPVALTAPGTNPDTGSNGVAGTANLNVDFGLFQPLSLGNVVFADTNNDGVLDDGETGIAGVTVTLLDGNGNVLTSANGAPITTTTDANGNYLFTGLTPGTYEVLITTPAGYQPDTLVSGDFTTAGNNSNHGAANPGNGSVTTGPVTLTTGGNPNNGGSANLNVDVGFRPLSVDLAVTIAADAPLVPLDGTDGFTITVTNNGPGNATGVRVTNWFPPGVTLVGVGGVSQGSFNPNTGIWMIGNLAVGQVVTLRVIGQVASSGPLVATAVVSADEMDTDPANNISSSPVAATLPVSAINKSLFLSSTTTSDPSTTATMSPTTLPAAVPGSTALYATGAGPGGPPLVEVFDRGTGQMRLFLMAFNPAFLGGVSVAMGDVNGDGVPDVIVGAGTGGGSHVEVFDGVTGQLIRSFFAFDPGFMGAVSVAAGDVTGSGHADIIVGAGAGGHSNVEVFDGVTGQRISSFFAFAPGFMGAVSVAAGDVTGSGHADVIVGAGAGGHSNVAVFDGVTGQQLGSFYAFAPGFMGAVSVAAGDVTGSGRADIIVGAGAGGNSNVVVLDGVTGQRISSFDAFASGFAGAVNVSAVDLTNDGQADVVVSATANYAPVVVTINPLTGQPIDSFLAYDSTFLGGVSVSADNW